MGSRANVSAVSGADGVATGVARRSKRVKGSAMSSAACVTLARLSRKEGTRASTLRRKAVARAASGAFAAVTRLLQRAVALDGLGRPCVHERAEASDRILQQGDVGPLRGQPRALDEHGRIVRLQREELLQQPLRLGVSVRPARVLDLLDERRADLQAARVQFDRAAQARNAFVAPAARRFETTHQERHLAGRRRQVPRALDRGGGSVEVPQAQVRQPQVGPHRRLPGRELGRLHELLPGRIHQAHLEPGETAIEVPDRLLVGVGSRCR